MVAKARDGDVAAAEVVLRHAWSVRKGRPLKLALPPIATLADVGAALEAVMSAMAAGEISAEEAGDVSAVIESRRKALESIDLEERVAILEARAGATRNGP
jgi:hypothetical protein